jgi:hypothetical protein
LFEVSPDLYHAITDRSWVWIYVVLPAVIHSG